MAEKKVIISGEIGFFGTMPNDVRQQLADAGGGDLDIQINSPGGSMPDGFEIYNMIRDYKRENSGAQITITLKGEASSMASYIAVNPAADLVIAEDNATFMIHNPWNLAIGDYREMEKMSSILKGFGSIINRAYAEKIGKTSEEVQAMMDAETWLFGEEMKTMGFVDEIIAAPDEEKIEKEEAIAASRLRFSAMQEKIRKSENAKADILKVAALIKHETQALNNEGLNISGAAAPKKNEGGSTMAEEAQTLTADDITLDWLQANKPELVDAIKSAAAEEEKERQQEIDETEEESDDDSEEAKALFKAAKYGENPMNAGEVAKQLMTLQAKRKAEALKDRTEDGKQVPSVKTDPKTESDILAGIKAGMKMRRVK
jgi:ATP-dependent protease ClpP protease subunit